MSQLEPAWVPVVDRPHPPLFIGFLFLGTTRERLRKATGIDVDFQHLMKVGDQLFLDRQEFASCVERIEAAVSSSDGSFYEGYARDCYAHGKETLRRCDALARAFDDGDSSKPALVAEYAELMMGFAPYLVATVAIQSTLTQRIDAIIAAVRARSTDDLRESDIRSSLLRPKRPTDVELARDAELALLRLIQKDASLEHELARWLQSGSGRKSRARKYSGFWEPAEAYVDRFGWLTLNYYVGTPDSLEGLVRRLLAQCNAMRSVAPGTDRTRSKVAETTPVNSHSLEALLGPDEISYLDIVREYFNLRAFRLLVFFRAHYALRNAWPAIATAASLPLADLVYLTHEELPELLDRDRPDLRKVARLRREEGFQVLKQDGRLVWSALSPATSQSTSHDAVEALEGEIAYPGHVRGIVRVAHSPDDAEGVTKGHVLLATMTTPAFGPSLWEVAAIVTDEGGLLCHAAVISREMGTPCVVGTAKATRVLQSGDLVEVDASRERPTIRKVPWQKGVRRPSPPLWKYFSIWGQRTVLVAPALDITSGLDEAKSIDHQTYVPQDSYDRLRREIRQRIESDPAYYRGIADRCYEACHALTDVATQVRTKMNKKGGAKLTPGLLRRWFTAYHEATLATIPFRWGLLILDELLTHELEQSLANELGVSTEEAGSRIPELAPQSTLSFEAEYARAIRELALQYQSNAPSGCAVDPTIRQVMKVLQTGRLGAQARAIVDEYEWLRTSYFTGNPITIDDVGDDVTKVLSEIAGGSASSPAVPAHEYRSRLSERTLRLLDIAGQYIHLRSFRISVCYKADFLVRPLLVAIASHIGINYFELIHMTGQEILSSLETAASSVPRLELQGRSESYELFMANERIWARDTPGANRGQGASEESVGTDSVTITGRTAFQGHVTGPVVLVDGKRDAEKIRPGSIVVSPMTTTDLTTAITSNAIGIVTDEGGTMSHAAVISRENEIPCVVGTGDATKRLIDGDVVEIEATATRGEIRLVSHAAPRSAVR